MTSLHNSRYSSPIVACAGLTPEAWRQLIFASIRKSKALPYLWEWKAGYLWDVLAYADLIPSGPGHSRNNYRWIPGEGTVFRSPTVVCLGCLSTMASPISGETWLTQSCGWCMTFPTTLTRSTVWATVQYWYAFRQNELLNHLTQPTIETTN